MSLREALSIILTGVGAAAVILSSAQVASAADRAEASATRDGQTDPSISASFLAAAVRQRQARPAADPETAHARFAVERRLPQGGAASLGWQNTSPSRGFDGHEINAAFTARPQDMDGFAGAKVSFHF